MPFLEFISSWIKRFLQASWKQIKKSRLCLTDPLYYLALCAGFTAWLTDQPLPQLHWSWLLTKAFIEEYFFRFGLQQSLNHLLREKSLFWKITWANLITSLLFCAMHLFRQSPKWALLTIPPSLVFGFFWDRYKTIIPSWIIHFVYNFLLFYRFY
jgi:membrane protease YdiL (CAAX protease family)